MIILGLDPGIGRTGYGILNTDKSELFVACGCLTTTPNTATSYRLYQLGQDLSVLISRFKPESAVIEQIFFGTNSTTAILTAQARGVFIYILQKHHIPITSLTPLQIKSQIAGFGKADKRQIQTVVQRRLRLSQAPQPDDAADALAAALCVVDKQYQISNISA